jgi:hypothetical protein
MIPHPFMPDISSKSLDDIVKEMNNIYVKMRTVRDNNMLGQMRMVLNGYQSEYQKRMQEEAEKPKGKQKEKKNG